MNILIINGPNLNLLGIREVHFYKSLTYNDLLEYYKFLENKFNVTIEAYQTNHEGSIIDKLHEAHFKKFDAIIINPGAYTHYSYAIRDAIAAISIPTFEVHLTDITKRENWRRVSVISEVCIKTFMGNHFESYEDAVKYIVEERNQYAE